MERELKKGRDVSYCGPSVTKLMEWGPRWMFLNHLYIKDVN